MEKPIPVVFRSAFWMLLTGFLVWSARPVSGQQIRRVPGGYEVTTEHRFSIRGNESRVEVDNYAGDVDIAGSRNSEIVVTESVVVDADDETQARDRGVRYFSDVELSGNVVSVRGAIRHGDDLRLRIVLARGTSTNVSSHNGDVTLRDADAEAELATGSGDLTVERVTAPVKATTGSGDIEISDVSGATSGVSGAGDVTFRRIGGDVDVATGAGDLSLSDVTGRMELSTGGGDVDVSDAKGDVSGTTAGGDIDLQRVTGNADLTTSGGSIDARDVTGNLDATTMGGDIEGDYIGGTISAESMAGDIDFYHVKNSIVVTSQVGEIHVRVEDASFLRRGSIALRADNGDIRLIVPDATSAEILIDLGFDGEFEESQASSGIRWSSRQEDVRQNRIRRISGRLGDGGGRIDLHTESGRISLRGS